jgi:rhodanese-related sulfurtransferase
MTTVNGTTTINSCTLKEWLDRGTDVTLLDVRTPAEFETAHIPGSYNVPLDQLDEHRVELQHLDHPVILVCRSGSRATQAKHKLIEVGPPRVQVLEGGVLAWEQQGGDLRRGRQRWDLERQVRLVAGSLVLGGILASVVWPGAKCLMGTLLSKLPYNRAATCDVDAVVAELARGRSGQRTE